MVTEYNIEDRHKGEAVEILFFAKDPDQTVITDPGDQTITVTISDTVNGDPVNNLIFSTAPYVILTTVQTGEFLIQLTNETLSSLTEGLTYYYNIWSQLDNEPRRLQAKGKIVLGGSIEF